MKQSGIDWIGEIPDDWKISKAKTILRNKSIKNHPEAEVLSLYRDLGIVPKNSRDDNHNVTSDDTASYKFVQKGELVLNKMKTWQGSLAVSDYEGIVSPAYYVCEFTNQEIDKKYIHYLLRNKMYAQEFERLSTGLRVGQWDLNIDDFLNTPIVYPPKKTTQQCIAEYLDKKVSEIDSIIEESKKSIEEYKAWKQSVIFEAITGKDLSCKKKESGIDTVGLIPIDWKTRRLRFLCDIMTGNQDTQDANPDGKYYFYVRSPNVERSDSYTFEGEGILMAGDGAGAGKVFHHAYGKYAIHQRVYCFYNFRDINTNFFYYYISLLFSIDMEKGSAQSTVPSVRMPMIKDFIFCFPPLHEQEAIAKMLDSKCTQIDSLIAEKESLIADLTEYKKSLIFEVVTGKRSV